MQVCCNISGWLAKLPPRVLERKYDGVGQGVQYRNLLGRVGWVCWCVIRIAQAARTETTGKIQSVKGIRFAFGNSCADTLRQLRERDGNTYQESNHYVDYNDYAAPLFESKTCYTLLLLNFTTFQVTLHWSTFVPWPSKKGLPWSHERILITTAFFPTPIKVHKTH